jgi:glyceraldehyde-3-phosphate dehydrogenase/erythrose-4-phosphate dehydrogenase
LSHHQPSSSVKAEAFAASSDASRRHHHHEHQIEIIVIDDTDEESLDGTDAEEHVLLDATGHQTTAAATAAATAAVSFRAPQCEHVGSSMIVVNKEEPPTNEVE